MNKATFLNDAINRAKREILRDVATGVVPTTCATFSELHDYVDANEYGGMCEESKAGELAGIDLWNSVFGESDNGDWISQCTTGAINTLQSAIGQWIVFGGLSAIVAGDELQIVPEFSDDETGMIFVAVDSEEKGRVSIKWRDDTGIAAVETVGIETVTRLF